MLSGCRRFPEKKFHLFYGGNMFNIGDLIVLEIALLQFMDRIDLSVEAGRHCSQILGKLEAAIAQQTAAAQSHIPSIVVQPPGTGPSGPALGPNFKPNL